MKPAGAVALKWGAAMTWHDCSMIEAIKHATGRVVAENQVRPESLEYCCDCVVFTDGTAIACRSEWRMYGGDTGDVDADDPAWQVYRD
jgi:hypothetical protein